LKSQKPFQKLYLKLLQKQFEFSAEQAKAETFMKTESREAEDDVCDQAQTKLAYPREREGLSKLN